ncbi:MULTISPECIES: STAS domain-containing protein [Streptomyces]|uniref:STAS domain-containing protein n=1 Tax=Streptomyces TaxID=1883 RepID=UPI0029A62865|nr:STAS domain-containing protein [Streptomyces sp. WI03-4A]MDX2593811.1 STAS domain-containing protein [Streptomyces sp. WI03-4A]
MTTLPPSEFTLSFDHDPATLTVRVAGELDYDTSDDLLEAVIEHLTGDQASLRDVRLDFSELTWIDSSGLSALLMIHRRASAMGAVLHLDNRPDVLERMLRITNVLDHLTAPPPGVRAARNGRAAVEEDDGITGAGAT